MSKQKVYFGTDGIRQKVGEGMMCPENVLKIGWALGTILHKRGEKKVLIGKDTRISGYMFESALEAGLISAGMDVYMLGPIPTPAVSYFTQNFSADAGVVITASHNPYFDNGLKFFGTGGKKISDDIELEIEDMINSDLKMRSSEEVGKAFRINDSIGRYIEFCKSIYNGKRNLSEYKIVLDCANGAGYQVAPAVFSELGADVIAIGVDPDGLNINKDCGATDLKQIKEKVLAEKADFGIALDGDADRIMMINSDGKTIDGDAILYILASNMNTTKSGFEGVVGTEMSNLGLEYALEQKNIKFERTKVGDRFVMERLIEKGWYYGAEQSGHVLCLNKIITGDGVIAALKIITIMINKKKTLDQLLEGFTVYPQILHNVKVNNTTNWQNNTRLQTAIKETEKLLGNQGRVLVRASGTEPLIRVMLEAQTNALIEEPAALLAKIVKEEFNS